MEKKIETTGSEPRIASRSPRWWRTMSIVAVALVLGVLMRATFALAASPAAPTNAALGQSTPADDGEGGEDDDDHDDDHDEHDDYISRYGVIVTRPVEKVGTWVISTTTATSYTVTDETVTEGVLAVGACVEVKSLASAPTVAIKIQEKDAYKCNNGDDDDDDDDEHDDINSRHGEIVTRPVESIGVWVIGSKSYSVTESTVLEGALEVGTCVEVKTLESDPTTAIKIEAKDAFKCNDDDDDDDDDDDHHGDVTISYGLVVTRPEGRIGTWVIGNVAYSATANTEFDYDHGDLEVGTCAKVKSWVSNPTVAKEIESEKDYKCGPRDDDDHAHGILFGVIEALPTDVQSGTWLIGGSSFVVSPTTEIITKGIPLTVGLTVKVEFTSNISDTYFAKRIEVKFGHNNPCRIGDDDDDDDDDDRASASHGGDDDHRYGQCPGREGKSLGLIDSRPAGSLLGNWMIGGVPYVVNAYTKFHHNDELLVGERVRVEFVVLSDNLRYATKIKEVGSGIPGNPNASLIVGYVDAKPDAFVGNWVINGAPFVAVSDTVFIERGSLLAVGAYVVVEYEIVNDVRLIRKILTYVPPGAGDDDSIGRIESIGVVAVAAQDAALQEGEVWTVGGVNYIVTEATQLLDGGSELAEGSTVFVNSYTADGQRYATLIRAQGDKMFLPQAGR